MKLFIQAYDLLCEDKVRTISVIFQLVIFIIAVSVSFGALSATNMFVKTTEKSGISDDLYFFGGFDNPIIDGKTVREIISEDLGSEYAPVSPLYCKVNADDGSDTPIQCDYFHCDKLRRLHLRFKKGRLPDVAKPNECVITSDLAVKYGYKTGDTVSLTQSGVTFHLKITGILSAKAQIPSFTVAGTSLTLKALYTVMKNRVVVFSPIVSDDGIKAVFYENRCGFIDVPDSISIKECGKILEKYGSSLSVASMITEEKEENRTVCNYFLTFAVLIFFVGFTGIGVNNFLILQQKKRQLGIYYICGMSWGSCFRILILRNILTVLFSGIFSLLAVLLIGRMDFGKDFSSLPVPASVATLFSVVLVCLASYPVYLKMKRTEPIEFLKSGW